MHQKNNGERIVIDISNINEEIFAEKRNYIYEEWVRCCIIKALKEAREIPQYNQPFEIVHINLPRKVMSIESILKYIKKPEEAMTNRLDETLRWAQILSNGEKSWEDLCRKPDTASFPRLVLWNGMIQKVGGGKWAAGYTKESAIALNYIFLSEIEDVKLSITKFNIH